MGFTSDYAAYVEFGLPLKPTWRLTRLLNSFLTFRKDAGAVGPRALAARESGVEARTTSAGVGEKRGAEEIEEEEEWEYCVPAPDPEKDIPDAARRELFHRELVKRGRRPRFTNPFCSGLVDQENGRWYYNDQADFELASSNGVLPEAFRLAMKELVGSAWAEKIVLRIDVAGGLGEPQDVSLRLAYKVRSSVSPVHFSPRRF